jgi:hypothetical protein
MLDLPLSYTAILERHFGDEDVYGIWIEPEEERCLLPDGGSAVVCTDLATFIANQMPHRAEIYGYFADDNEGAETNEHADGHDFVLLDDRYIIDPWLSHVAGATPRTVFDLVEDAAEVRRWYGSRENWTLGAQN